ncbi:MAG: outer membrane beta-barrel protein [Thermodesulfobacteriota bacterium]
MNWIRWLILFPIIICTPTIVHAWAKDILLHFQTYITVQEEYNSNIDLTPNRFKRDDFITTISPGFKFSTTPKSPVTGEFRRTPTAEERFGLDLDFNAGFVFYGKEHEDNYISLNGTLNAWYSFTPNLSFRVRDYLIRSDEIRETDYSATAIQGQNLISRTNRRVVYHRNVFEPSVEYRFGREDLIAVNYRNNIYKIQSRILEDSMENYINPRLIYWFNIRNGVSLEYGLTLGDFQRSPDLVGHMATGRYTYRFNPRTSIFGEYTYLRRDFEPPSIDYDVHRPSLGIEHAFNPTLSGRAQLGYFWQNPDRGSTTDGFFYDVNFSQRAERTTYTLSFQGGYTEDYFTAENLGFTKYHRAIGTISHRVLERMNIGFRTSFEWAKYGGGEKDRIWGIGCNGSYEIFRWLTISLDVSHRENHSNVSDRDYSEYRGMLRITATY